MECIDCIDGNNNGLGSIRNQGLTMNANEGIVDYHGNLSPTSLLPFGYARSAAEACRANDASKFRQLPCRTFISTGTCPYRDKCVYLHDPRVAQTDVNKFKTRRKNREDIVLDSMFWPVMPPSDVQRNTDQEGNICAEQLYAVPIPRDDQYKAHDECIFSLWHHFLCFFEQNECTTTQEESMQAKFNYLNRTYVNGSGIRSEAYGSWSNQKVAINRRASNDGHSLRGFTSVSKNFYVIQEYHNRKLLLNIEKSSVVKSTIAENAFTSKPRLQVFNYLSNGFSISEGAMLNHAELEMTLTKENSVSNRSGNSSFTPQTIADGYRTACDDTLSPASISPASISPDELLPSYQQKLVAGQNAKISSPTSKGSPATVLDAVQSPIATEAKGNISKPAARKGGIQDLDPEVAHLTMFSPSLPPNKGILARPLVTKIYNAKEDYIHPSVLLLNSNSNYSRLKELDRGYQYLHIGSHTDDLELVAAPKPSFQSKISGQYQAQYYSYRWQHDIQASSYPLMQTKKAARMYTEYGNTIVGPSHRIRFPQF